MESEETPKKGNSPKKPKTNGENSKMTESERLSSLERLKLMRDKSGMSYSALAEASGVPETTVQRIFSGRTPSPQMNTIRDLIRAMGGRLSDVFPEDGVFPESLKADLDPKNDRASYIDEKKITKAQAIKALYEGSSPALDLLRTYAVMIPEDKLLTELIPMAFRLSEDARKEAEKESKK